MHRISSFLGIIAFFVFKNSTVICKIPSVVLKLLQIKQQIFQCRKNMRKISNYNTIFAQTNFR